MNVRSVVINLSIAAKPALKLRISVANLLTDSVLKNRRLKSLRRQNEMKRRNK